MVVHSGGSSGNDAVPRMPSGSSLAGRGGSSSSVARQALKKGPWTAAEDAILIEYVKKNGEGNWNAVQKNTSLSRCGKSCRLRWTNHLRPNLKKGSFTPEEERLILQLHAQLGNKWARMAAQLPGRTDNEIKNYWNTRIKRRIRQGLPLYLNHIAPQRQPTSPPVQQTELQAVSATTVRGRLSLQIPNRTISQQVLAQPHSPSLHSPTVLSPAVILDRYRSPAEAFFPGFSLANQTFPLSFPTASSFQFSPLNFNTNSLQALQTQQSPCTFYTPLKPVELPSNQLFSPQLVNKPVPVPEPKPETRLKPSVSRSSSIGLLEDLLEQAEALASNENSNLLNLQDDKFEFSLKSGYAWDEAIGSNSSSAGIGMGIKNEVGEDNWSEEISNLLQHIPSPANIPRGLDHLGDSLNIPALDFGSGIAATEDSLGLDMQQLASIFQVDPASCPWSSMPRIC